MIKKQRLEIQNYEKIAVTPRFCYFKPKVEKKSNIAQETSFSLSQKNKFIHSKFFYDMNGSNLFENICELPEYYLTRSEFEILDLMKVELPKYLMGRFALVELGSGSSIKTRKLLEILNTRQKNVEYYPVDISDILKESSINLHDAYENLKITGIIDQYETGLEFIQKLDHIQKLIAFLGSSMGNFDTDDGIEFLKKIRHSMGRDDMLLLGLDLIKDAKILESAYNDSQGVTADFNLNMLNRLNRELNANFDLDKFEHVAVFNKKHKRIEMYLKSLEKQQVFVSSIDLFLKLKKGELIHTENSHKYTIPQIKKMAKKTGFKPIQIWTDKKNYFTMALLSVDDNEKEMRTF
jgi:L-histidine Nalpha-methyltransferase